MPALQPKTDTLRSYGALAVGWVSVFIVGLGCIWLAENLALRPYGRGVICRAFAYSWAFSCLYLLAFWSALALRVSRRQHLLYWMVLFFGSVILSLPSNANGLGIADLILDLFFTQRIFTILWPELGWPAVKTAIYIWCSTVLLHRLPKRNETHHHFTINHMLAITALIALVFATDRFLGYQGSRTDALLQAFHSPLFDFLFASILSLSLTALLISIQKQSYLLQLLTWCATILATFLFFMLMAQRVQTGNGFVIALKPYVQLAWALGLAFPLVVVLTLQSRIRFFLTDVCGIGIKMRTNHGVNRSGDLRGT